MSNVARPIVLLDIDGVLNPLCAEASLNPEWSWNMFWSDPELDQSDNNCSVAVHFAPDMLKELLAFPVDLRWLTTWMWRNRSANLDFASQTRFRHLPTDIVDTDSKSSFKLNVVKCILKDKGPQVIWIDDDIEKILKESRIDFEDIDPHTRCLPIVPISLVGLTKGHLEQIKEFITLEHP